MVAGDGSRALQPIVQLVINLPIVNRVTLVLRPPCIEVVSKVVGLLVW
eukprot:CAMPEP_0180380176 /NCGR_PEP_ID=MMETSP0989-20121125/25848_1 /TAXON_ID=697907 /ORGANISM="non described non described, Strain CCMP2293" /LENGTH=47 /DNA_ID= /DNA_START= /DNA_END= /DNA_ORIENTATION=